MAYEQKEKLELKTNIPQVITFNKLLKAGETEKDNKKWQWWMYNVIVNGSEMIFFTNDRLQAAIDPYLKANKNTLEVLQEEEGRSKKFIVREVGREGAEEKFDNETEQVVVEEKVRDKEEGMAWGNAKNCASTLLQGTSWGRDEFEDLANWIYNLQPKND